jgi:hypothetical protein
MLAALLSSRIRRWAVLTVGVPAAAWAMKRAGEELEQRRGESMLSGRLQQTGGWLGRRGGKDGGKDGAKG